MISLVSPEYSFEEFCLRMVGKDLLFEVMDAASAEITYVRQIHRQTTKDQNFRKGSKGRLYCEDLQRLISLIVNGSVPADATTAFLHAVKPLKWERDQRRFFANLPEVKLLGGLLESVDFLNVVVSRRDVEAADTSSTLGALRRLIESPATARQFFERVDIAFHGYDDASQELFEIVEVRDFVYKLDEQFPFGSFFCQSTIWDFSAYSFASCPRFSQRRAAQNISLSASVSCWNAVGSRQ
jgi:hypothetical protein